MASYLKKLFSHDSVLTGVLLFTPIVIAMVSFWPGLHSPFWFDDIYNLEALGKFPNKDDFSRAIHFVFSGSAGPTGRPVSLASFLIHGFVWPTDPWAFKYTNLLIHCMNGLLVFLLTWKLLTGAKYDAKKSLWVASAGSLIWLCHPMQVSTVLYAVQRMTQLSALFTLLGIILILYGREKLEIKKINGLLLMSLALIVCGLLAIYSKENGILIFAYIAVVELLLLRHIVSTNLPAIKKWFAVFIWAPMGAGLVYFLVTVPENLAAYNGRNFNLFERLLTESRVVCDYIYNILIPKFNAVNIYHDDFTISKSPIDPLSTLPAIVFITLCITLAIKYRKQYPLQCFGILWFFAGHLIESTVIPLELYFDHRNYLPMFGLVFAVVSLPLVISNKKYFAITRSSIIVGIFVAATATFYNAYLWAKPVKSLEVWALEHPGSVRTLHALGGEYFARQDYKNAELIYRKGLDPAIEDGGLIVLLLFLKCYQNELSLSDRNVIFNAITTAKYRLATTTGIGLLSQYIMSHRCENFTITNATDFLDKMISNAQFSADYPAYVLHYWKGRLLMQSGKIDEGIHSLDESFRHRREIHLPLEQAILLINNGRMQEAKHYIKIAQTLDAEPENGKLKHFYKPQIDQLSASATLD